MPSNAAHSPSPFAATPATPATRTAATAMLLAAGRGERMRPLTDVHPKPLLQVHGKPLMQWAMEGLWRAGVKNLVINTAWLGEQIPQHFGAQFVASAASAASAPMQLHYSHEGLDFGAALETAGGIVRALPLLSDVFWVCAGDVFAPQFAFSPQDHDRFAASPYLAHIWLVPNPAHNPLGDFGVSDQGLALNLPPPAADAPASAVPPRYTFSTIALYKRAFFEAPWCPLPAGNPQGLQAPLAPMLRQAMDNRQVSASVYEGPWTDVGTPERLAHINQSAPDRQHL